MAARYGGRRNNGPKPETALRKAQDFLRVGKSEDALKHLHAILVARRYKVWTETYEEIMFLYVELAVKLQENVKEGLMQYQKITNPEHYASLKKVINRYMELAELRTLQAVAEAEAKKEETISEDADGVDLDDSPESLMLQAVTGEDSDARTDKKILAPKVKYLYETYRAVLDVLRNISLLQDYYQLMCRHAFRFCERYRRTSEFRKFMDQMRKHMLDIEKHGNLTYAINLKSSETQRLYLQTRVVQLKVAASLELWTMAYHTIEDIHDNTELSETIPSASLKKIFYEKLARIFQASDNNMFHAYCLGEYYSLVRKDGQLTPEQDTALADAVVLAALSIPPTKGEQVKFMVDNESNRRLATYLGFDTTPTRAHLLSELQAEGVLENASPEVRELHTLFETSFGPLSLTKKVEAILQRFEQKAELEPDQSPACSDGNEDNVLNDADDNKVAVFDLHTYLTSLRRLTVLRLIEQLSQVYSSLRLAKLYQLSPDMGSHWELERIMLVAAKQGYVRLRLDHRTQMVWFQPPSSGMDWDSANINKSLSGLFDKLSTILQKVAPVDAAAKQEERKRVFEAIWEGVEGEHRQVARRIAEIEKRKQNMERQQQEKERRDAEQRANEKAKRLAEEQERLKAEAEKRVREKEAAEKKLKDMEEKKKQLQKLQEAQQSVGVRAAAKKVEELKDKIAEVDAQDLVKAREELEAEAERRKEKRRTDQQRAVDFLERAIRLEELPKRKEYMKVELKQMRQRVDLEVKREQDEAQLLAEKREQARARLAKYRGFKEKFVEKVMAVRKAKYEKELEMRREREEERRLQEEEEEEERRREEERRDEERAKEEEERAIREKEEEEKEKEKEKERAEKEALEEAAREERVRQREKERQERLAKLKREELGSRETEEDKRAAMRGGREGEDREPGPERERERPPVRGGRFARDPDEAPSARSGGGRFARDEDSSGPPRGVRFGRDDDERRPPIRGDDRDREPRDRDGPFRSGGGPPDRFRSERDEETSSSPQRWRGGAPRGGGGDREGGDRPGPGRFDRGDERPGRFDRERDDRPAGRFDRGAEERPGGRVDREREGGPQRYGDRDREGGPGGRFGDRGGDRDRFGGDRDDGPPRRGGGRFGGEGGGGRFGGGGGDEDSGNWRRGGGGGGGTGDRDREERGDRFGGRGGGSGGGGDDSGPWRRGGGGGAREERDGERNDRPSFRERGDRPGPRGDGPPGRFGGDTNDEGGPWRRGGQGRRGSDQQEAPPARAGRNSRGASPSGGGRGGRRQGGSRSRDGSRRASPSRGPAKDKDNNNNAQPEGGEDDDGFTVVGRTSRRNRR